MRQALVEIVDLVATLNIRSTSLEVQRTIQKIAGTAQAALEREQAEARYFPIHETPPSPDQP